ncbi:MAG: hypothetical protein HRT89_07425 [Lentisphaeria bacterium]|nr:hypothetical protein [Lentisphaeria bacterium]NQZ67885.1 hypothetical protein [Lentisphaeria bacterium]
MAYKKGESIDCPHCGSSSVAKIVSEMDGWTKLGEMYACALCDAKLASITDDVAPAEDVSSKNVDAFADFLGTEKEEIDELIDDDGSRPFCKNCTHLLQHPFKIYCMKHEKDVNPMDDCKDFINVED